jgi:hypothetical protein
MKTFTSFLLLALGACASAPPAMELSVQLREGGAAQAVPATYSEWVESLPILSADSTAFRTSVQGRIALKVRDNGVKINFDIQLGSQIEYLDLRHFKEDVWVHAEMPAMPEFAGFQKVDFGIKILADGNKLFITPEFADDALGAQIKSINMGIEGMTLTLDIKLFEELMQLYWHTLESADVDLSSFLPEGMSAEEFFERGLNPAGWARAYMLTSEILDFRVDSNEVRIKARMKDELMNSQMLLSGGRGSQLANFNYEMSFDRFSGLPTSMTMQMDIDTMVSMTFELDFAKFEMGADLFAPGHFNSEHIDSKHLFPLDTFVQMALASMHAGMVEDDGDLSF